MTLQDDQRQPTLGLRSPLTVRRPHSAQWTGQPLNRRQKLAVEDVQLDAQLIDGVAVLSDVVARRVTELHVDAVQLFGEAEQTIQQLNAGLDLPPEFQAFVEEFTRRSREIYAQNLQGTLAVAGRSMAQIAAEGGRRPPEPQPPGGLARIIGLK